MTEEINKREKDRQNKRANVGEKVRPWNIGLTTNITSLKNLAGLEWNFESFYMKVKRFAPSVSREELKEFIKEKGIDLKVRPKGKGNLV
jgi:glutathione peroxidase-family protein